MPVLPKPPGTVIYPVRAGIPIVGDFLMPVGSTGIVFVAALQGVSQAAGPTLFPQSSMDASYIRAASTLSRWGIISGVFFQFIRLALKMSEADVAVFLGTSVPQIQAWESGVEEIPRGPWIMLADEINRVDVRSTQEYLAPVPDRRPRQIRIFPDIPQVTEQVGYVAPPC